MINILLAGVGGQGTVLASTLLQNAYMDKGLYVKSTETIGMSQMGGSVSSHIRAGERVHSPFVPKGQADVVFAFEPAEAGRNLAYTKKDTVVIANQDPIKPVTDTLAKEDYSAQAILDGIQDQVGLYVCDFSQLFDQLGTKKPLNIAMVGYGLGLDILGLTREEVEGAMVKTIKKAYLDMNMRALEFGIKEGQRQDG